MDIQAVPLYSHSQRLYGHNSDRGFEWIGSNRITHSQYTVVSVSKQQTYRRSTFDTLQRSQARSSRPWRSVLFSGAFATSAYSLRSGVVERGGRSL